MSCVIKNFIGSSANPNIEVTQARNGMAVIQYKKDLSVNSGTAISAYFASQMNVHQRQLVCDLSQSSVIMQAGAMQWMAGNVTMSSNVKGVGDLLGKAFKGKVTGESAAKPHYSGDGVVVLEPTEKYLILMDVAEWGGAIVLEDGMFLAAEDCLKESIVARSNLSSAIAGGEGLFNLCLEGQRGVFCVESRVPKDDLVEIELQNDTVKIDGNYAVAWSAGLAFTVEKSTRSLIGSAISGEGFVNVYRGTGKIWMEPLARAGIPRVLSD